MTHTRPCGRVRSAYPSTSDPVTASAVLAMDRRTPAILISLLALAGARELPAAPSPISPEAAQAFARYCYECHGLDSDKGELAVQEILEEPARYELNHGSLENILEQIEEGLMPPRKAEAQPDDATRETLAESIRSIIRQMAEKQHDDPGLVVMPRLNRDDYARAARDLAGVRFARPPSWPLPAEGGAGEGFGNVGQAQGMNDALLEKYLHTAKEFLSHLRADPDGGFAWDETPRTAVESPADLRREAVADWVVFHQSVLAGQPERLLAAAREKLGYSHGAYWEVAWAYEHRAAFNRANTTFAELIKGYPVALSPSSARLWHEFLTGKEDGGAHLNEVRARWSRIPPPGRQTLEQRRADIAAIDAWFHQRARNDARYPAEAQEDRRARRQNQKAADERLVVRANASSARELWLVISSGGDASTGERLRLSGTAVDQRQRSTAWDAAGFALEDARGQRLSLGGGGPVLQAPGAWRIRVPAGFATLELACEFEAGGPTDPTVQLAVLDRAPLPAEIDFLAGKRVRGRPGSALVRDAAKADEEVDRAVRSRVRRLVNNEVLYFAGFDDFDVSYLGAEAWKGEPPGNSRAVRPYALHPLEMREDAMLDPVFGPRLQALRQRLRFVAQIPHQDLAALRRQAGAKDAIEGEPIPPAELDRLPSDQRRKAMELTRRIEEAESGARAAAARDLAAFVRRAWRRDLSAEENAALLARYDAARAEGRPYDSAIKATLQVALMSPQFLYRLQPLPEAVPSAPSVLPLDPWALASRLSFFLWSSVPDEPLLAAAREGRLSDPAELRTQVARMLQDERARALAELFAGQWLGYAGFSDHAVPDAELFPEFTPALRVAMEEETTRFLLDIVQGRAPVLDLIAADYTYLNEDLARHYGVPGVEGPELRRVQVDPARRGGILAQGSVLTKTSTALRTSPVLRGVWLIERILGQEIPTPPPVPALSDGETSPEGLTLIKQLEAHRADPSCASCHNRIDPPGLSLENFDAVGRWRDSYSGGLAVDAAGRLPNGTRVEGLKGLRSLLLTQRETVLRTFATKLIGYALGRAYQPGDDALRARVMQALADPRAGFPAATLEIVTSRQFTHRRAEPAAPLFAAPTPAPASPALAQHPSGPAAGPRP